MANQVEEKNLLLELIRKNAVREGVEEHHLNYVVNGTYQEIRKQIINQEIHLIDEKVKEAEAKRARQKRISETKRLILEVVLVTSILGLIVNQLTEVIGRLKGHIDPAWFNNAWTFSIIVLLVMALLLFLWLIYFDKVERIFSEKGA